MRFDEAIAVVSRERVYQDKTYDPDQVLSSGLTRRQRDMEITSHLVLLDQYVEKAKAAWLPAGNSTAALKEVAKIAAIAIRALERVANGDELATGLR